jgi:Domain of unknown function (DUF4352)
MQWHNRSLLDTRDTIKAEIACKSRLERTIMKKSFLIGAIFIVGTLVACGESNTGTPAGNTTPQPSPQPAQHFKVNDVVKVGSNWQVTVNSVKTDTGGQYSALKTGNVYLLVDVSMVNISNKEQSTSSLADWKLTGTDGQSYNASFFSGAPTAPDGKVEAGSPAKGTLTYEVPASVKNFKLAFTPSLFTSGQTIWDLTVL